VATSRAQRLVNLVICLRSARTPLSADQVRRAVQGYEDCGGDEAFQRMFERDKKALRDVGVPIEQGTADAPGSPIGYRIAARDYELPELDLSPEQAGLLAVAAELWRSGERGAAVDGALAKLRAGGLDPVGDTPAPVTEVRADAHELTVAAAVSEAVASGAVITFDHSSPGASAPARRRVEPWWAGSREGRWYLVGHDLDRDAPRVFRLARVSGVGTTAGSRTVERPSPERIAELLDRAISRVDPRVRGRVWVAEGHAAVLRSLACATLAAERGGRPGDELDVAGPLSALCALVAGQGPDAVALDPPELVDRVRAVLRAAADRTPEVTP